MDLLLKYKEELEEISKFKSIDSIIIFGSYSENKVKPLSDLDICIIARKISPLIKKRILSYSNEELDISFFEDLPLSLQYKILTKGILYYSKTDISKLKIKTTNLWFDFRHGLNKLYISRGYTKIEI